MKKNKFTSSFIIGLFALTGILLIIGTIFWLGANEFFKTRNFYLTYFEGSVQGLEQGSSVKYLGVPVGNVSDINISEDGKLVEVKMQIDPDLTVLPSMRVKSEYSGLAGGKFLQIFIPEKGEIVPKTKLGFKPKFPVIYSTPSGIDELASSTKEVLNEMMKFDFGEISSSTIEMINQINNILKDKNIVLTLENMQQSSKKLSVLFSQLDTTKVVGNFISTSYDIANSAEELVNTVNVLKTKIQNVEVSGFLNNIYADYDTTMTNLDNMIKNVSARSDMMIISLNGLIEDIRKSNKELKNTIQGINDDPSNIFLVRPPKKEK
ncbi:MAG: hypothetical protein A2X64_11370 [Ignavibacteria bacterium GWF2_33_9]|nr:MAG: hypothetical protein A2X64_11370 [Ignavibacteria bacterium GWF2_33_9]